MSRDTRSETSRREFLEMMSRMPGAKYITARNVSAAVVGAYAGADLFGEMDFENPPRDLPPYDGVFEDIDGDGEVTIDDHLLYSHEWLEEIPRTFHVVLPWPQELKEIDDFLSTSDGRSYSIRVSLHPDEDLEEGKIQKVSGVITTYLNSGAKRNPDRWSDVPGNWSLDVNIVEERIPADVDTLDGFAEAIGRTQDGVSTDTGYDILVKGGEVERLEEYKYAKGGRERSIGIAPRQNFIEDQEGTPLITEDIDLIRPLIAFGRAAGMQKREEDDFMSTDNTGSIEYVTYPMSAYDSSLLRDYMVTVPTISGSWELGYMARE